MLNAARDHFPALARWVAWTYGRPTVLQFGDAATPSATGVQQGDPLGPLLFAAAIQPMAAALRSGLDLWLFYLDDGVLAGDVPAVAAALTHDANAETSSGIGLAAELAEV